MTYEQFRQKLLSACSNNNVLIIAHKGPDDDAIGSVLAMERALQTLTDATVTAAFEGERTRRWENFPGYETITFVEDLQSLVDKADLVIFLDGSERFRFSTEELRITAPTFCVDHHPCETPDFDEYLIEPDRTSVAEMIYELFPDVIDKDFARYVLLGIIGDTGNFRFINSENAHVFGIAQDLVEKGNIDVEQFQRSWGATHRGEFKAFAKLMGNAVIVEHDTWPTYCYSLLEESDGLSDEDISGGAHMFVSWVRGIQGVEWGFVLTPRSTGLTACSFRSAGVNVRNIVEGLGVGGGHDRAAGARFDVAPKEALKLIQGWIANNAPEQTN